MRDAYLYATEGEQSREILLVSYLDRFGVDAVLGRKLHYREMRQIVVAENVIAAYKSRARSQNWATWATENPQAAHLLQQAVLLSQDE